MDVVLVSEKVTGSAECLGTKRTRLGFPLLLHELHWRGAGTRQDVGSFARQYIGASHG